MRTSVTISLASVALLVLAGPPPVGAVPLDGPGGASEVEQPGELEPLGDAPATASSEDAGAADGAPAGDELRGVFRISPGVCDDGGVTEGSYFRMVQPGGSPENGPFVDNGDSPCGDGTYTPLSPGADGGLLTGEYQAHPEPAFDGDGNALADRITSPQSFFGTRFSTATNPTDPQTGTEVDAPRVFHDGAGELDGDLRAFAAAWNGQHFNQGAPKPDGSRPGNTAGPTGTYDTDTRAFTLTWSSRIQGGPFNGFTGVWHLEGTFEPSGDVGASGSGDQSASADGDGSGVADDDAVGATGDDASGGGQLPDTGGGAPLAGLLLVGLAGALALLRRRDLVRTGGASR